MTGISCGSLTLELVRKVQNTAKHRQKFKVQYPRPKLQVYQFFFFSPFLEGEAPLELYLCVHSLYSPDHSRRVFFEDDHCSQLVSHQNGVPQRTRSPANSLATLERGTKDLTSLHQPRSRTASDSGLVSSLYSPFYVRLLE